MVINKELRKKWYQDNKERIAILRRKYEKVRRQIPEVKEKKKQYMKEYRQRKSSKESKKIQDKKYAKSHRENIRKISLISYYKNREDRLVKNKIFNKQYYTKNRDEILLRRKNFDKDNPLIYRARYMAYKEISLKEKCELCGSTYNLERHHKDYNKPLEVITLCINCHVKTRKNYRGNEILSLIKK